MTSQTIYLIICFIIIIGLVWFNTTFDTIAKKRRYNINVVLICAALTFLCLSFI